MKIPLLSRLLFALLIAFALMLAATQSGRAQTTEQANPKPQPILKLRGIDGRTYDVAEMRGNVVLVSFGATWCAPCISELRALEQLRIEYKAKPVKFLWVSIDSEAEASDAKLIKYAKERKLTVPVLRDPISFAFNQFSARKRLPMIVFFGKDGRPDALPHFGMSSQPENYKTSMRQRLNKLLAQSRSDVE